VPTTKPRAGFVRLKSKTAHVLYYSKDKADYISGGDYTVWTIAEWKASFRYDDAAAFDGTEWQDPEGRLWEFFGYSIPLYDEKEHT
jgi:hypothetical protein